MMDEYRLPATNKNISFDLRIRSVSDDAGDEEQGDSRGQSSELSDDIRKDCFLGDGARLKQVIISCTGIL